MGMFDGEGSANGDFLKFAEIGATHEFEITTLPRLTSDGRIDWVKRTNNFGKEEEVARIGGRTESGDEVVLGLKRGGAELEALIVACREAGKDLAVGGRIKIAHHATKDVGKGNPMKLFKARYTPPVLASAVNLDDF